MITAHRAHRHFNLTRKSFDVDRYLDEQLAAQAEERRQATHFAGLQVEPGPRHGFRNWAVRLNDRIERWMDRVDWIKWDIRLGTVGGFFLTGFVVYMAWVVTDAWLQGRFNLGGN